MWYQIIFISYSTNYNETFEYSDLNNKFKFISEQVEKNISAYYKLLKDMKYYVNNNVYWKYNLLNKKSRLRNKKNWIKKNENEISNLHMIFLYLQIKKSINRKTIFDYRGIVTIYINRENNYKTIFCIK